MTPLSILYLAPDPVPAPKGAGVRIERTVRTLVAMGHDVRLLTPSFAAPRLEGATPETPRPLALVAHDTVPVAGEGYLERMLALRTAAARWLRGRRADLVVFRGIWEGASALRFAHATGAAALYEAHGFPSIELPSHFPALGEHADVLEKLIHEEAACLAAASLVVTPSATGRRFLLQRGVPPARIAIVRNTADPARWTPPAAAVASGPPLRLVYTGTLAPWQGLATLLEALVPYRAAGDVELHAVGTLRSVWKTELRTLARRLKVQHLVHLSGPADPVALVPVLQTAGACVAPLPADPRNVVQGCCPIKLLEYMATGRPILSTRIPPVTELLADDEAVLVRPSSPQALAHGIAWLRDHPTEREERGARARERFLRDFAPPAFRAALERAIAQAVAHRLPSTRT